MFPLVPCRFLNDIEKISKKENPLCVTGKRIEQMRQHCRMRRDLAIFVPKGDKDIEIWRTQPLFLVHSFEKRMGAC